MATLKDVAELAGVSTATVSHVLNGKKKVTPEVLERVQQAVSAAKYSPNTAARALRTGRTGILGLIVPDITNPFFSQLAQAVEARAKAQGYATVLLESGYEAQTEAQGLEFLTGHRVDALVWVPGGSGHLPLQEPGVPTVILDYAPEAWHTVRADDYGGGRMQARFALEAGHRRVVLLWGPLSIRSIQERRRGFLEVAGGQLEVVDELEHPFSVQLSKSLERKLLARQGQYTFLACGNDVLAVGAMRTLKRAGVRIPEDVSVMGFDDTLLAEVVDPPLTTVSQPIKKLGTLAVNQVLRQVRGEGGESPQLVVPVTLKERESTRRLTPVEAP